MKNVGAFWKTGNDSLKSLLGLDKIKSIDGFLKIENNDALQNLNGLENLTSISEDLVISNNESLVDFCSLVTLFNTNGLSGTYAVDKNLYNPSEQYITNGNCEQN